MKNIITIKNTLLVTIPFVVMYLLAAFIDMQINPYLMNRESRVVIVILTFFIYAVILYGYLINDLKSKKDETNR